MKTKNEIAIKLTDKNRKKVQGILEMFGEKIYRDTTLSRDWYIEFYEGDWVSSANLRNKTLVKPKELRNILATEKLKEGDYVVCNNGDDKSIVKVKGIEGGKIIVDKELFTYDGIRCEYGFERIHRFQRYATQEEIDLLEGNKSLEVGKWYKYKFNLNGNRHKNGYLLFNFNGLFKENSQYGLTYNLSGGLFCNDISIYKKK